MNNPFAPAVPAVTASGRAGAELPWMRVAWAEADAGVTEIAGPRNNPRIIAYHKATGLGASDDETPWCASFVAWCFQQVGIAYTVATAARALDWLKFGEALSAPIPGCLAVFTRRGGGHVGFVVAVTDTHVHVLGGNQSNAVNVTPMRLNTLKGYRWPEGVAKPGPKPMAQSRTVWATITGIATSGAGVIVSAVQSSDPGTVIDQARDAVGHAHDAMKVAEDAGGVVGALARLLGFLPAWGWGAIGVGALLIVFLLLWEDRRKRPTASATPPGARR